MSSDNMEATWSPCKRCWSVMPVGQARLRLHPPCAFSRTCDTIMRPHLTTGMCIHMRIDVCAHTVMCTPIHLCMHMQMQVSGRMNIHAYGDTYATLMNMCAPDRGYVHGHMCTQVGVCTSIHLCIHMQMCVCSHTTLHAYNETSMNVCVYTCGYTWE